MKKYEAPEMSVISCELLDIVTTSPSTTPTTPVTSGEDEGKIPGDWGEYMNVDFQ